VSASEYPASVNGLLPTSKVQYNNYSVFGEYQFSKFYWLRPVLGARYDIFNYVSTSSPRLALLSQTKDKIHNFRLVGQSSYRNNSADKWEINRNARYLANSWDFPVTGQPDAVLGRLHPAGVKRDKLSISSNKAVEFGYTLTQPKYSLFTNVFRNFLDISTWDDAVQVQVNTRYITQGFEAGGTYKVNNLNLGANHSNVRLFGGVVPESFVSQDRKDLTNYMQGWL
jgi:hypothetical protein